MFISSFQIKKRLKNAGYGAHSDEEMKAIFVRDLRAANDILGSDIFYGGETITIADCAVFGQLASFYFVPFETEAHGILRNQFPALVKYIERVAAQYFSDFPCGKVA